MGCFSQPTWSFSMSFLASVWGDGGWNQCLYASTVSIHLSALDLFHKIHPTASQWSRNIDRLSEVNASGWMMPRVWFMSATLGWDPCGEFPPSEQLSFLWWDRPLPFNVTLFKRAKVEAWLTFIRAISWCSRKILYFFHQVELNKFGCMRADLSKWRTKVFAMLLPQVSTGQHCWKGLGEFLDCGQCWSLLLLVKESLEVPSTPTEWRSSFCVSD